MEFVTDLTFPGNPTGELLLNNIIHLVIDRLAQRFRFGYHDIDDMKQQGWIFALRGLESPRYNPKRPVEKFLYVHIRNRFINFRRDKYSRNEPPCLKCPFYAPASAAKCNVFERRDLCDKYLKWEYKHTSKRLLMTVAEADEVAHRGETPQDTASYNDLISLIDTGLPESIWRDYCRARDGGRLPEDRKRRLQEAVRALIGENYEQED